MKKNRIFKFVTGAYWALLFCVIIGENRRFIPKQIAIILVALLFCCIVIFNSFAGKKGGRD